MSILSKRTKAELIEIIEETAKSLEELRVYIKDVEQEYKDTVNSQDILRCNKEWYENRIAELEQQLSEAAYNKAEDAAKLVSDMEQESRQKMETVNQAYNLMTKELSSLTYENASLKAEYQLLESKYQVALENLDKFAEENVKLKDIIRMGIIDEEEDESEEPMESEPPMTLAEFISRKLSALKSDEDNRSEKCKGCPIYPCDEVEEDDDSSISEINIPYLGKAFVIDTNSPDKALDVIKEIIKKEMEGND